MPDVRTVVLEGELGVDGIGNFAGDLFTENNTKLLYAEAYGTPGTRAWGEWEKLLRTNPFVAMGMDFVGGHIRDARVGVKPAEGVADAQRHADFVLWALTEAMEPGIAEVNQQMVEGLTPGFALHELVWGNVSSPLLPGGSGYAVVRMAERLPSTLAHNAWHVQGGDLSYVRQQGPADDGTWRTAEIPAEKLQLATWKRKGNNFAGYSVWRPGWYLARIQEQLLKLAGISLVREGAGIPTAVSNGDRGAKLTPSQRKKLQRLLENLVFHENAAVVMPAGWDIKWVYSPGANKGHVLDAWQQLGQCLLQLVQAQQLVLGVNGTGSRSVGDTHDAQSMAFIQGVASWLEGVWNGVGRRRYTGVVKKLIDANFGPQVAYPRLTLTLKRAQLDPKTRMDAMGSAVSAGALTITVEDENAVREDLGLAPIDPAVREAEKAKKAALAPKLPGSHPEPDKDEQGGPPDADEDDAKPPAKLGADVRTPRREPRPSERVLDFGGISRLLDSAPLDFEARARPIVTEMLVAAAPAISAAMADGKIVPAELATLPLDTSRLEAMADAYLSSVREAGNRQVVRELRRDGADGLLEKRADGKPGVRLAAGDEDERGEAIDDADEVQAAELNALVRRVANRLRGELEREAIDVLRTGGDAREVVSRTVVRQLETGAFKADAGTVTARIMNVGRDEAARVMGGVTTVERSALLDSGTCAVCEAKDGDTAEFGSPEHDRLVPPERDCQGGGRCRCLLVYRQGDSE